MAVENIQASQTDNLIPPVHPPQVGAQSDSSVQPEVQVVKKEEMVEIPKSTLDSILARLDTFEKTQKLMLQVEDATKLDKIDALRRQGKLVKTVKIRKIDGNYVLGWKLTKDDVYFSDGKLIENQEVTVYFSEGLGEKKMSMRQWASTQTFATFEVISESRNKDGQLFLTIKSEDDGTELSVDVNYIN